MGEKARRPKTAMAKIFIREISLKIFETSSREISLLSFVNSRITKRITPKRKNGLIPLANFFNFSIN